MKTKKCSKCKEELSINMFNKNNQQKNGIHPSCKICKKKYYNKIYREIKCINYIKNRDLIRKKAKEYYQKTKNIQINRVRQYQNTHKEEIREYNKRYAKKHYYNDIKYKLSRAIRTKIVRTLHQGRKNRQKWEKILKYTVEQLKQHLEKQFQPGMSWSNYGKWHIDHIKPISAFNYKKYTEKSFEECWALTNLQPLWAKDNISKGGVKYDT